MVPHTLPPTYDFTPSAAHAPASYASTPPPDVPAPLAQMLEADLDEAEVQHQLAVQAHLVAMASLQDLQVRGLWDDPTGGYGVGLLIRREAMAQRREGDGPVWAKP